LGRPFQNSKVIQPTDILDGTQATRGNRVITVFCGGRGCILASGGLILGVVPKALVSSIFRDYPRIGRAATER
jgi:hypothetical protein